MNSCFSKGVIQEERRDNDFPRQAKYKVVHLNSDHLTSPIRNFKRDSSSGGKMRPKATKTRKDQRTSPETATPPVTQRHKFISLNNHSECR